MKNICRANVSLLNNFQNRKASITICCIKFVEKHIKLYVADGCVRKYDTSLPEHSERRGREIGWQTTRYSARKRLTLIRSSSSSNEGSLISYSEILKYSDILKIAQNYPRPPSRSALHAICRNLGK